MTLFDIRVNFRSGKNRQNFVEHFRFCFSSFSCEYCQKGFLHQTQLYAHHKQRHATENQNAQAKTESVYDDSSQTMGPVLTNVTDFLW